MCHPGSKGILMVLPLRERSVFTGAFAREHKLRRRAEFWKSGGRGWAKWVEGRQWLFADTKDIWERVLFFCLLKGCMACSSWHRFELQGISSWPARAENQSIAFGARFVCISTGCWQLLEQLAVSHVLPGQSYPLPQSRAPCVPALDQGQLRVAVKIHERNAGSSGGVVGADVSMREVQEAKGGGNCIWSH